ncbi:hypothetical protein GPECTOR_87g423 [Gonium pectorale]|uniref:Protein kinase domain-containing protein n=1 Tax=Gonium pectorale TaxID=33097 RepID=A0A150G2M1_GONPE|nr:hypothetical protein GPECTOR_87g423 [Gonium pectorale]|eukprot:KXZ43560.1 hypothetical protein GPECTOR_87g423 [Gonium pectorale]
MAEGTLGGGLGLSAVPANGSTTSADPTLPPTTPSTVLDLTGTGGLFSIVLFGSTASVELRDLTILNPPLGPRGQYPWSQLRAFLWTFDFQRRLVGHQTPMLRGLRLTVELQPDELAFWLAEGPGGGAAVPHELLPSFCAEGGGGPFFNVKDMRWTQHSNDTSQSHQPLPSPGNTSQPPVVPPTRFYPVDNTIILSLLDPFELSTPDDRKDVALVWFLDETHITLNPSWGSNAGPTARLPALITGPTAINGRGVASAAAAAATPAAAFDVSHLAGALALLGVKASLTLRALTLANLPAAGLSPIPLPPSGSRRRLPQEASESQGIAAGDGLGLIAPTQGLPVALANFTSCLWTADFDRPAALAGGGTAADVGAAGGEGVRPAGLPYVFLDSVALVVPQAELDWMSEVWAAAIAGGAAEDDGHSAPSGRSRASTHGLELVAPSDETISITGELGRGAQGVVYRGVWRGLPVAVKSILVQVPTCKQALGGAGPSPTDPRVHQAVAEAAISASVNHPNLVATYTYMLQRLDCWYGGCGGYGSDRYTSGRSGGGYSNPHAEPEAWKLTLVQELCEGGSLRDCLAKGVLADCRARRLPKRPESALHWERVVVQAAPAAAAIAGCDPYAPVMLLAALQAARGLAHLHSRSIVHADVSSANILLQRALPLPLAGPWTSSPSGSYGTQVATPDCIFAVGPGGGSGRPAYSLQYRGHSGGAMRGGGNGGDGAAARLIMQRGGGGGDTFDASGRGVSAGSPPASARGRAASGAKNYGGVGAVADGAGGAECAYHYGWVAKLCDFGLSGLLEAADQQTHLSGPARRSSAYSAPELVRAGRAGPPGDVYSLAVVMWELALGQPLLEALAAPQGQRLRAWLAAQAAMEPEEAEALPPGLLYWPAHTRQGFAELVGECLREAPADRPSAERVCERLEAILVDLASAELGFFCDSSR